MIANAGADAADARAACSGGVEIVELPLDDSWLRDCGPIYTYDGGRRIAVHFFFNAWGEKFAGWDRDAAVGRLIAQRLGDKVREAPIVLEGGSIVTDGSGDVADDRAVPAAPQPQPDAVARDRSRRSCARASAWSGSCGSGGG